MNMGSQETFKIFCGNLSPVTNDNDLHEVFSRYGTVVEAVVMTGKNFGFVHMASEAQGMKALHRLENYILNGQKIMVQRAINSKRATSIKRNIVGLGISNLDDFDNAYEVNDNVYNYRMQDITNIVRTPHCSSPVSYTNSINPASSSNLSENSSGRLSPLLSSASSSYTPERRYKGEISETNFDKLEIISNLEDKSVCGICNERYDDNIHIPKILSCNHTFCLDCLTSITKGSEIKCPAKCPYITHLQESGVSGLTTNQTKLIKKDDLFSGNIFQLPVNQNIQRQQSYGFPNEVCVVCLCIPPNQLCTLQKHQIMSESDAFNILKPRLGNLIDITCQTLRNVMTMQASLKERMQYTLHSLNKFSEELKIKIDGEEQQQAIEQRRLETLNEHNLSLLNTTSIIDLLDMCNEVQNSSQTIASKYSMCFAKDAINTALDTIRLQLKESILDRCLSQLGFAKEEAFSLASSLKENADRGNFANVVLIYLLSDLLSTRYRQNVIGPHLSLASKAHSFGNTQTPNNMNFNESELTMDEQSLPDSQDLFDINKIMSDTIDAIESCVPSSMNGLHNGFCDEQYSSTPIVSSAMYLGISNTSLIGSDDKSVNGDYDLLEEEDGEKSNAPRPASYLDAVKKPAKQTNIENQAKQLSKSVPSPMKPSKFPHCWMVLSVNGVVSGRIIFQLRPDKAPKMCDNFIGLCTGRSGYGYKGTHFFKNGDGYLVGGDVENDDGSGGFSTYDKQKFEADLCPLKDDVGMVRFKGIGTSDNGRGMVGSQFMIWCMEREFKKFSFSLVFGRVVDGLNVVQEAASQNLHKVAIKVEECGAI